MISGSQCWYFKSPNQTRPYPKRVSRPCFDSSAPHIRTQSRQWLVLWNKAKPMLITCREETKQPQHPIAELSAPWVLSSAEKLIRYLHESYFLPYRNTVSTPDVSGATKYCRTHYNQWYCIHWMWRGATRQISDSKLPPRSIYDILMQISNDFQRSRVLHGQTLAVAARRPVYTQSKPSVFLSWLGSANVNVANFFQWKVANASLKSR